MDNNNSLALPDILKEVLALADKPTLAKCSALNKYWSKSANKYLWESLTSLRPLLELLAPLIDSPGWDSDLLHFDCLSPIYWERFNVYAPLVKRLHISTENERYGKSVVSLVALWRPSFSLLPRLQELNIDFRRKDERHQGYLLDLATVLLDKDITSISLSVNHTKQIPTICGNGRCTFLAFLDAISCRSPFLRRFKLAFLNKDDACKVTRSSRDFTGIRHCIMNLFPTLHYLETVELCPQFASAPMSLSSNESLKSLNLRCNREHIIRSDTTDVFRSGIPVRPLNALVSPCTLEALTVDLQYSVAIRFLRTSTLTSLRRIDIQSQTIESTEETVQELISIIGTFCPYLEEMRLQSALSSSRRMMILEFGPLQNLSRMRSFTFRHVLGWCLDKRKFEELLSRWPLLEELHISFSSLGSPLSGLNTLSLLAKHCPKIRKVTLPLDFYNIATNCMLANTGGPTEYELSALRCLKFEVATSVTADLESKLTPIAIFLIYLSVPSSTLSISPCDSPGGHTRDGSECNQLLKDIQKYMVVSSTSG